MAYFLLESDPPDHHNIRKKSIEVGEIWLVDVKNEHMTTLAIFEPEDEIWEKIQQTKGNGLLEAQLDNICLLPAYVFKITNFIKIKANYEAWVSRQEISKEEACLILFEAEE